MTTFLAFAPDAVTILDGETIEWRNRSLFTHTVTADPALAADPADVELPPDAASFDSGEVAAGQTYRRTCTVPGTYRYVCRPHEGQGMMGTIVVRPRS
jgi:plastocyanin